MIAPRPGTVEPRRLVMPTRIVLHLLAVALFCTAAEAGTLTLAWDPSPDPAAAGYRVYVGTSPRGYVETYDIAAQSSFVYTQVVGGTRYYFAVAAMTADGRVGPLSDELSAVAGAEVTVASADRAEDSTATRTTASRGLERVCTGSDGPCYSVRQMASGLGAINALTVTRDGRLLFIEDGQRIRVLGSTQLPETALVVDPARTTLVALALDPEFDVTGYVYVGEMEGRGRDGRTRQAIARYRLLNNVLGERLQVTTVATGTSGSAAPFTVGSDGRLYVAVPATGEYAPSDNGVSAGAILRFMLDGTVPQDNWRSSPLFAIGVASPDAVAFDLRGQRLWIGAAGPAPALASVELGPASVAAAPRRAARSSLRAAATDSGSVLVAAAAGASESSTLLVTGPGQVVYASTITPGPTAPVLRILPVGASGPITAVAMDQSGRGYVVTQSVAHGGAPSSAIVALIPEN